MSVRPGYKRTEVGDIPEDWECVQVTSVARLESGHTPSKRQPQYWGGEVQWVSLHDSQRLDGDAIFTTTQTITAEGLKNSSARILPAGTVIFSRTATVGKATILGVDMATSQDFAAYVCGPRLNNIFLMHLFRSMSRFWYSLMAGSTHNTVYMPVFRSLRVQLPPIEEQHAIAAALSDVDALLIGLDRIITKKRDLKHAAMQQLLTGQSRLPGFSGEWDLKRLGEICEIEMGRTPSRLIPAYWGRGYTWLSIGDLKSKFVSTSSEEITELAASTMTKIPKGTLLMSFKLSIGRLCFSGCDLYTNEAICSFNNIRANADFLYYILGRVDFSLYGKQAVKGYTLNKYSLNSIEIPLPPRLEQAAIASVLSDMDAELDALEARRAKTAALKQGMMQELLTGRTRLV